MFYFVLWELILGKLYFIFARFHVTSSVCCVSLGPALQLKLQKHNNLYTGGLKHVQTQNPASLRWNHTRYFHPEE